MRIAILGATSEIAKDLVLSFDRHSKYELVLYARRPEVVKRWMSAVRTTSQYVVNDFIEFSLNEHFDSIINFVGVGNPAKAVTMGASIFDITLKYDELALSYLYHNPNCRYIFLSSGAVYGSAFDSPVDENTKATFEINNIQPQDWYALAKLHAESRHRSLTQLSIVDIRVFNYFSHTQDMSARFLITDIVRSIQNKTVLKTSTEQIVRDYIHPSDFYNLVASILRAPATNTPVDCYSLAPVDKQSLLIAMKSEFGLCFEVSEVSTAINATGRKPYYHSHNSRSADFGYQPKLTSLQSIIQEIKSTLTSTHY